MYVYNIDVQRNVKYCYAYAGMYHSSIDNKRNFSSLFAFNSLSTLEYATCEARTPVKCLLGFVCFHSDRLRVGKIAKPLPTATITCWLLWKYY